MYSILSWNILCREIGEEDEVVVVLVSLTSVLVRFFVELLVVFSILVVVSIGGFTSMEAVSLQKKKKQDFVPENPMYFSPIYVCVQGLVYQARPCFIFLQRHLSARQSLLRTGI